MPYHIIDNICFYVLKDDLINQMWRVWIESNIFFKDWSKIKFYTDINKSIFSFIHQCQLYKIFEILGIYVYYRNKGAYVLSYPTFKN